MEKISRETIRLLARHSDLQAEELDAALQQNTRAASADWHWLLRVLLLALGCGFLASGILFFFAWNWADIPKFGKLGLATAAVAIPVGLSVVPRLSELLRKSLLTTGAFLVGPLFGVFGQIYQTGADAYDLFFAWAAFIAIWVLVADFASLWVLFIGLLNITSWLYAEQVAGWDTTLTALVLFVLNTVAAAAVVLVPRYTSREAYPVWLVYILTIAAAGCGTVASCSAIMNDAISGLFYLVVVLAVYGLVFRYASLQKQLFYLVTMAFSLIAIGTALIIRISDGSEGFFLATLWVMLATVSGIYFLNHYRKAWSHE